MQQPCQLKNTEQSWTIQVYELNLLEYNTKFEVTIIQQDEKWGKTGGRLNNEITTWW